MSLFDKHKIFEKNSILLIVGVLIVVAIGGLGSLRGPFLAALLIGVTDTACKYWLPAFGAFFIYVATIVILLWRPRGLFGSRV